MRLFSQRFKTENSPQANFCFESLRPKRRAQCGLESSKEGVQEANTFCREQMLASHRLLAESKLSSQEVRESHGLWGF
jgi:hypothetical protein